MLFSCRTDLKIKIKDYEDTLRNRNLNYGKGLEQLLASIKYIRDLVNSKYKSANECVGLLNRFESNLISDVDSFEQDMHILNRFMQSLARKMIGYVNELKVNENVSNLTLTNLEMIQERTKNYFEELKHWPQEGN